MDILDILNRPIAYHRCFVPFGGVTGAVMLSQAVYWQQRTTRDDDFFYKTAIEWQAETGLTTREQKTARVRLVKAGVLIEKKCGVPCKVHYQVDKKKLSELLRKTSLDKSAKLDSTKAPNKLPTKPQNLNSGIVETITEITAETITKTTAVNKRFVIPVFSEVEKYCNEVGVNPNKWFDHYTANGWKVGKNKMVDWRAAVRTWINTPAQNSAKKFKPDLVESEDNHL